MPHCAHYAQHALRHWQGHDAGGKNEQASGAQAAELCTLLAAAGEFDVIDEGLMDAGSVISGCVGAWAQMFIEALADGAVEAGVPRAKAQKYAAGAVLGAAALALESGRHPGQLKDEVCSPAGSTIAGVHALERACAPRLWTPWPRRLPAQKKWENSNRKGAPSGRLFCAARR